jgi:hypothetical protein
MASHDVDSNPMGSFFFANFVIFVVKSLFRVRAEPGARARRLRSSGISGRTSKTIYRKSEMQATTSPL